MINQLRRLWGELYSSAEEYQKKLEDFILFIKEARKAYQPYFDGSEIDWYKDAVIYSLYVDLFNEDIDGLITKLDYLKDLGITCIWLLPILNSPMKDAGFDISDYTKIRDSLTKGREGIFEEFLLQAHNRGIRVIFDIAMNHCSVEHPWFQEAIADTGSTKRDYFIWSDDDQKYGDARIIFKGLCKSNWEWEPVTKQFYFHRFFEIQPDLNYRNPDVLIEMTKILISWKLKGLDGFRADAIPYIWKSEGTSCENLPETHTVVKFFRAALDFIEVGTLLLAEACQPPKKVVEYFGEGDECNAAYHFPVMPRIYESMAEGSNHAVRMALSPDFTPLNIPENCQWFMFLRCHDELTLEMVSPQERKFIFDHYCKEPLWSFREGEGVSARLASLLDADADRIKLAYSIMFSLLGTPIIFYGDEFGKTNDLEFYHEQLGLTGINDSRYLVRGRVNWERVENELENGIGNTSEIYRFLKNMIAVRKKCPSLGRGTIKFLDIRNCKGDISEEILAYERGTKDKITVLQNLSERELCVNFNLEDKKELLGSEIIRNRDHLVFKPYAFYWFGEE